MNKIEIAESDIEQWKYLIKINKTVMDKVPNLKERCTNDIEKYELRIEALNLYVKLPEILEKLKQEALKLETSFDDGQLCFEVGANIFEILKELE